MDSLKASWVKNLFIGVLFLQTVYSVEENRITLNEVLQEVIGNNLNVNITRLDQSLKEQDQIIASSVFDTTLTSRIATDRDRREESFSNTETYSGQVGLQKKLSLGTSVNVQAKYSDALNETATAGESSSYGAGISINVRQPLLKGMGVAVNKANIWMAETQLEIARMNYQNTVLNLANLAEKSYWTLAFQNARYKLSKSTIEVAESLLAETEERVVSGMATQLDVLQAKANLSNQREQIIEIENAVKNASDQLLLHMGQLSPANEVYELSVMEMPEPTITVPELSTVWSGALATDLNRKVQLANLKSLGYEKVKSKDELKTNLDLIFSGGSNGSSSTSKSDSWSQVYERDEYNWGLALEMNIPIGNRSSKAGLSKVRTRIQKEQIRLEELDQRLYQDVRSQWRGLYGGMEKLKASRISRELEEQVFEQAKVKYRNGMVLFRFVQEAQDALNRSRISELNAWIGVLHSVADLSRLDGTQLDRLGITVNFLNN